LNKLAAQYDYISYLFLTVAKEYELQQKANVHIVPTAT